MAKPVAVAKGVAFAFPDVCLTPAPPSSPVPIPYPNIAQLDMANAKTDLSGRQVRVGSSGDTILLQDAIISTSSGDEAGSAGGVKSGTSKGQCRLVQGSGSVIYGPQGKGLVRFMDRTEQNNGNAQGNVMSAFPTVLVGD
jgi:hypothetical protein